MKYKHEEFLNNYLNRRILVVYRSGFRMYGILRGIDQYSVMIDTGVQIHIIFKHEISEIVIDERESKQEARMLTEYELRELLSQ